MSNVSMSGSSSTPSEVEVSATTKLIQSKDGQKWFQLGEEVLWMLIIA